MIAFIYRSKAIKFFKKIKGVKGETENSLTKMNTEKHKS